ncbi:MAG: sulfatase-like hydrolase/transferase, partial [Pirellulaceae bacterium]|nr:sulfatase-like hydrolase/transferase [Pirellulaceae bacterium]
GKFMHPIYRNKERINDDGYLTTRLSEEAVAFIDRNKSQPFFLYLAYNAVHAPAQAPPDDICAFRSRFPNISKERAILMAMLKHLDDGVGSVVTKLKQEGLFDNTVLFFLTDNGGSKAMRANNAPLRGFKGSLTEGGIRTPFVVSWPERFSGGRTVDTPVISLDILPTALDAIDKLPAKNNFDGKSLLPLLTGASQTHHDTLFWCKEGGEWAVRRGDWKLRSLKGQTELFNLSDDPREQRNLATSQSAEVKALSGAFDSWIEQMADPITGGKKLWEVEPAKENPTDREKARLQKRKDRQKRREAEKKATKSRNASPNHATVLGPSKSRKA